MKILSIIENKDRSATIDFEFQEDEVQFLLNYAINNILKEQIELLKKEASIDE